MFFTSCCAQDGGKIEVRYRAFELQILNSHSFAALLFVVASGFTLIFGLLRVVNLAHRRYFISSGGYIGMTTAVATAASPSEQSAAASYNRLHRLMLDHGLLNFIKNQDSSRSCSPSELRSC